MRDSLRVVVVEGREEGTEPVISTTTVILKNSLWSLTEVCHVTQISTSFSELRFLFGG